MPLPLPSANLSIFWHKFTLSCCYRQGGFASPGRTQRGLLLAGSGDVLLHSQAGEEGLDFDTAHLAGVALIVEHDIAGDSGHVGFLGADGVVLERMASRT